MMYRSHCNKTLMLYLYSAINLNQNIVAQTGKGERLLSEGLDMSLISCWFVLFLWRAFIIVLQLHNIFIHSSYYLPIQIYSIILIGLVMKTMDIDFDNDTGNSSNSHFRFDTNREWQETKKWLHMFVNEGGKRDSVSAYSSPTPLVLHSYFAVLYLYYACTPPYSACTSVALRRTELTIILC
jgi:hypothetical protein